MGRYAIGAEVRTGRQGSQAGDRGIELGPERRREPAGCAFGTIQLRSAIQTRLRAAVGSGLDGTAIHRHARHLPGNAAAQERQRLQAQHECGEEEPVDPCSLHGKHYTQVRQPRFSRSADAAPWKMCPAGFP